MDTNSIAQGIIDGSIPVVENPPMQVINLIIIVVILGLLGGIASGARVLLTREIKYRNIFGYFTARGIIGIAGAFVAVVAAFWVDKLYVEAIPQNYMHLMGICTLGGLASFHILPKVDKLVDKELMNHLNHVETKADTADDKAEKAISTIQHAMDFASAMTFAQAAIAKKDNLDIIPAIDQLSALTKYFPNQRRLHIVLGCLHRRNGDLKTAIITLRNFLESLETNKGIDVHYEVDRADAHYNIACYHALLYENAMKDNWPKDEQERLKKETYEALKIAVNGNSLNISVATDDKDLKSVKTFDEFKALLLTH